MNKIVQLLFYIERSSESYDAQIRNLISLQFIAREVNFPYLTPN